MNHKRGFTIQSGDGFEIDIDLMVEYHVQTPDMTMPGAVGGNIRVIESITLDMTDEEIARRVRLALGNLEQYADEISEELNP